MSSNMEILHGKPVIDGVILMGMRLDGCLYEPALSVGFVIPAFVGMTLFLV
jgi:hypothetical protein